MNLEEVAHLRAAAAASVIRRAVAVANRIAALVAPGSPAAEAVAELRDVLQPKSTTTIQEIPMPNIVPGGVLVASPRAEIARTNPLPTAPQAAPPPVARPVAPMPTLQPGINAMPAAAVAAAEPLAQVNQIPGVGVVPIIEPPARVNQIPGAPGVSSLVGAAPFLMPAGAPQAPATDPAARRAQLEAEIAALDRGEVVQPQAAPRPSPPAYLRPATSRFGRLYLHHASPPVPGVPRHSAPANAVLPPSVDLREYLLPATKGGVTSVGVALAALREAITVLVTGTALLGRLDPDYVAARVAAAAQRDVRVAGSSIAEELMVAFTYGIAPEGYGAVPAADIAATPWRIQAFGAVDLDPVAVKSALAQRAPVLVMFAARESFESPGEGGLLAPYGADEGLLGGHAVLVVGYDDRGWIVLDAAGPEWGDRGYVVMPYGYERSWIEAWTAAAPA